MNQQVEVDGNRVLGKLQELYPVHLNHAIAEVKAEMLAEELQAFEDSPDEKADK